jgi:hypothetical protein
MKILSPKNVLKHVIELFATFNGATMTADSHLEEYLKKIRADARPGAVDSVISEVDAVEFFFEGCVQNEKATKAVLRKLFAEHSGEVSRADTHLYAVCIFPFSLCAVRVSAVLQRATSQALTFGAAVLATYKQSAVAVLSGRQCVLIVYFATGCSGIGCLGLIADDIWCNSRYCTVLLPGLRQNRVKTMAGLSCGVRCGAVE